jgi:hypothetical protein
MGSSASRSSHFTPWEQIYFTVNLTSYMYVKYKSFHLINHGSCILHNAWFPVLICCVHRKIMECNAQRERMFWLRHLILVTNMNVSNLHLNILDNLCCKFFHKCIIGFGFICKCVTSSHYKML